MNILEREFVSLKDNVSEMLHLVLSQINKSKTAFCDLNMTLAEDIISQERRVNALELMIDKQCEKMFALHNPVATDLRLTIAILKMNSDIERIGDYAESIANYVVEIKEKKFTDSISNKDIEEMFGVAIDMMEDIIESVVSDEVDNAKKVFEKDRILNKYNKNASEVIEKYVQDHPEKIREALYVFSTIKKIERLGDHIKNIAEDWVYYLEGKVLKHKS